MLFSFVFFSSVQQQRWDLTIELAEQYHFPQIEGVLVEVASTLLDQGYTFQAIRLYRRTKKAIQAAALLSGQAKVAFEAGKLKLAKKLHLLAAVEIEQYRSPKLETEMRSIATQRASKRATTTQGLSMKQMPTAGSVHQKISLATTNTLNTLLDQDAAAGEDKYLDNPWKGAEGTHLFILCQKQLRANNYLDALVTAAALKNYEDILGIEKVNCILVLAATYAEAWGLCSAALTQLEILEQSKVGESPVKQGLGVFGEVAIKLFSEFEPCDTEQIQQNCKAGRFICMATGKSITKTAAESNKVVACQRCGRRMLREAVRWRSSCPLCHFELKC